MTRLGWILLYAAACGVISLIAMIYHSNPRQFLLGVWTGWYIASVVIGLRL